MSGPMLFGRPQRIRRGATLTLVFGAVLATGAAAGSFGDTGRPGPRAERVVRAQSVPPARSAPPAAPHAAAPFAPAGPPPGSGRPSPDTAGIARAIDLGTVGPRAAARLVSRSGDRWSSFYTAGQYRGFQQELDGDYVGVGLWVRGAPDGTVTVARVQSGSPAARAGLRAGDALVDVDGTKTTGRPVTDVVARLRGVAPADPADPGSAPAPAPGSLVHVRLRQQGRTRTVALRREVLSTLPVTVTHPAAGVTAIAVDSFVRGVGGQVRAALAGGGHPGGVLLDLRGDSGGLVSEAVAVASDFLDGGLVTTYDVHGKPHALYAAPGGDTATPLVVLVDGGTMSAAEMLTGALKDRGRAVVVGTRTFGKGSVQMPSTLPDGSVAELTVGHYRTPAGRAVDGRGVQPDLTVPAGRSALGAAETVLSGLGTRS